MSTPLRPGVTTDAEVVELSIPGRPELLSIPRLIAAAVAARAGYDVEAIEDVRLATEELCLGAFEGRGPGRLHIRLAVGDGGLEVDCTFEPDRGDAPLESTRSKLAAELTEQLLSALADEHGTEVESGTARAWFRKSHRQEQG